MSFSGAAEGEEVRDLKVRLQILQTQYDHLAAKTGANKGSSQKAEDELEVFFLFSNFFHFYLR